MNSQATGKTHEALIEAGINFVACLPDSALNKLYEPLSNDPRVTYVQVANEGGSVGVCMGAWIGGLRPAMLMENTGFTLTCYALLCGPLTFGVLILLLMSYRGGFNDQRWFSVPVGWSTEPLLNALLVSYRVVHNPEKIRPAIVSAVKSMNSIKSPVSVVLGGSTLF